MRRARVQAGRARRHYRQPFRAGFLTTLDNPKSAIFRTGVFAVVVPAQAPAWFYATVLALVGAQSFLWYGTVAMTFSLRTVRSSYAHTSRFFSRVAGAFMLFFGLRIADQLRRELVGHAG